MEINSDETKKHAFTRKSVVGLKDAASDQHDERRKSVDARSSAPIWFSTRKSFSDPSDNRRSIGYPKHPLSKNRASSQDGGGTLKQRKLLLGRIAKILGRT